jgi:hypothetical protein
MVNSFAAESLARERQHELRATAHRARLSRHARRSGRHSLRARAGWMLVHAGIRLALTDPARQGVPVLRFPG